MEVPHDNPNEALTPCYIGEELVFVPVIDYYKYTHHPEIALAELAIKKSMEENDG